MQFLPPRIRAFARILTGKCRRAHSRTASTRSAPAGKKKVNDSSPGQLLQEEKLNDSPPEVDIWFLEPNMTGI